MNLRNAAGGLSRFAHLAGVVPAARSASDAPGPGEQPNPGEEPGEVEQPGEAPAEPAAPVPTEPPVPGGEPGNPPAPQPGASAAADFRRGFTAAQQRAAAILSHPAAVGNLALAAELATGNSLPASQALALLNAASLGQPAPAPRRIGLDDRMRGQAAAPAGQDGPNAGTPDTPEAVAQSILATMARARGKKD